ncbi:hypothetical protein AQPW35_25620 [Rubrivivax pictus]|uniref:Glycosyltransferase 2-like domain-containing protein n=1 Tax=Pseudaquabacterium pictum TaxID=2315236 RepID=A0A480APX4_9BURK|nr:hypothetical protein AQPW35_25620 [Rubrivivax pictus]
MTVVVPVYNKRAHVALALRSVLAQTDQDFALVVVCDPSTDGSNEEVARVTDPRLRVLHRDRPGPGGYAARNLGVRAAATEWVAFLDADDTWTPEHLARLRALAARHPGMPMLSAGWMLHDGSRQLDRFSALQQRQDDQLLDVVDYLRWEARGARPVWTGVVCLRKTLLTQAGGFPEDKIARSGDLDTWVRCVAAAGGLAWSPHVGGIYHRDAQNMVTRLAPVHLEVHLATTRRLLQATGDPLLRRLLIERKNNLVINAWVSNVYIPQGHGFRMGPLLEHRALLLHRPLHVAKCLAYDLLSRLPGDGGLRVHRGLVRLRQAWRSQP